MITFKQYIEAINAPKGNYMSIGAHDGSAFKLDSKMYSSGIEVPIEKRHVTLIYSENSDLDCGTLLSKIQCRFDHSFVAMIERFDCFDALPKEGERDENKATLVMKLKSPILTQMHEVLKEEGCSHSYPEFSPHISLVYDMDRDEANALVEHLNDMVPLPQKITLSELKSDVIVKDWAKTL